MGRLNGSQVRYYREKLGLSQEELAERSGLNRTWIGRVEWEADKGIYRPVTSTYLAALAKALGVSQEDLQTNMPKTVAEEDAPEPELMMKFIEGLTPDERRSVWEFLQYVDSKSSRDL